MTLYQCIKKAKQYLVANTWFTEQSVLLIPENINIILQLAKHEQFNN